METDWADWADCRVINYRVNPMPINGRCQWTNAFADSTLDGVQPAGAGIGLAPQPARLHLMISCFHLQSLSVNVLHLPINLPVDLRSSTRQTDDRGVLALIRLYICWVRRTAVCEFCQLDVLNWRLDRPERYGHTTLDPLIAVCDDFFRPMIF